MESFDQQVYKLCRVIPPGRVITYGGLAALIPPPAGMDPANYEHISARWVGYALKRCPPDVPWHRVVNARGEISPRPGMDLQRALLEEEGVTFNTQGRLDLKRYRWEPDPGMLPR